MKQTYWRVSVRVWHFMGDHHCPLLRYAGFYVDEGCDVIANEDNINRIMDRELMRWRMTND